jgi:hypothetical protein
MFPELWLSGFLLGSSTQKGLLMSSQGKMKWQGQFGSYEYEVYPIDQEFKDVPGNYIFAKQDAFGRWVPQYMGQTQSLADRLRHHEKEVCAKRNGATHIHAHANRNESSRLIEEKDLVSKWKPCCNVLLK